jgi:phage anti-repressor protein
MKSIAKLTSAFIKTALQFDKADFNEKEENIKQNGGQNKQTILLTIKCFKSLCLKAQTKKAGEIHEYYMKMEEVLHQIVEEETDELRLQLEQKENIILEKDITIKNSKKEKQKAVEQAIIAHFPLNTECIYFNN